MFIGTPSLVGVIGWSASQNSQRLGRIEQKLDKLDDSLNVQTNRITKLETKVDGLIQPLIMPR